MNQLQKSKNMLKGKISTKITPQQNRNCNNTYIYQRNMCTLKFSALLFSIMVIKLNSSNHKYVWYYWFLILYIILLFFWCLVVFDSDWVWQQIIHSVSIFVFGIFYVYVLYLVYLMLNHWYNIVSTICL